MRSHKFVRRNIVSYAPPMVFSAMGIYDNEMIVFVCNLFRADVAGPCHLCC